MAINARARNHECLHRCMQPLAVDAQEFPRELWQNRVAKDTIFRFPLLETSNN